MNLSTGTEGKTVLRLRNAFLSSPVNYGDHVKTMGTVVGQSGRIRRRWFVAVSLFVNISRTALRTSSFPWNDDHHLLGCNIL
jgi:hypothetical protein